MSLKIKNILKKIVRLPIYAHLLLAIAVLSLFIFLVFEGLTIYTRHNRAIMIPEVKGIVLEEAIAFFENNKLRYTIIDSVYSKEVPPGAIYDMMPPFGSKVKEGRILYITLNATGAQTTAVPDVKDLSYRQAYAILQSRGFTTIDIEYVEGSYRDLVIGVVLDGRTLTANENIPIASKLTLQVSDGGSALFFEEKDSTMIAPPKESIQEERQNQEQGDENWF